MRNLIAHNLLYLCKSTNTRDWKSKELTSCVYVLFIHIIKFLVKYRTMDVYVILEKESLSAECLRNEHTALSYNRLPIRALSRLAICTKYGSLVGSGES